MIVSLELAPDFATVIMMFKITSLIYVVGIADFFRAVILAVHAAGANS